MQEKKKLDDMAEKYKEEMMRIYNKKRAAEQAVLTNETESKPDSEQCRSEADTGEKCEQAAEQKKADPKKGHKHKQKKEHEKNRSEKASGKESCENGSDSCGDEQVRNNSRDDKKLMHPPMPEIPYERVKKHSGEPDKNFPEPCENAENDCTPENSEKAKFPTAKELISMDCADGEAGNCSDEESSVPASAMGGNERSGVPDPRFESDGNSPDDMDNKDGHRQGNYNFRSTPDEAPEKFEPDGKSDPGMFRQAGGQGYLQAEVTEQGSGSPISGAAVVVVRKLGDYDTLEAVLTTDSRGMTEAIALDVHDDPACMNDDPDSCGEYLLTVYKEGFYSVNMLPVPVFDTIKSIQPVEMTRVGS